MIDLENMSPSKPKGDKPMEKVVSFYVDDELFDSLDLAKFFLQKSKGEILREALSDYLDKNFPKEKQKQIRKVLKRGK